MPVIYFTIYTYLYYEIYGSCEELSPEALSGLTILHIGKVRVKFFMRKVEVTILHMRKVGMTIFNRRVLLNLTQPNPT